MSAAFETAAGTVIGRDHALARRNNQDAFCTWDGAEGVIAVVADGCGSGRSSEVGARLGARLVTEALRRQRLAALPPERVLERARVDVLEALGRLAASMGGNLDRTVSDYLLFTVIGAVVAEPVAFVFALGDGVAVVNGEADVIPATDNRPPYLAYGLTTIDAPDSRFQVRRALPAREVDSILLGTDGVLDLMRAEGRRVPGRPELVGPLSQFWEDDRHFRNPASLTRRLTLFNRDVQRLDWESRRVEREHGLLPDDTTLVVLRRKRA
jgi:hypothetical protein